MSTGAVIQLTLQGLVFIAWAVLLFRMLFTLRARSEAETGNPIAGPGQFLSQMGNWLRSDQDKQERKTLFFLTFVLFAMIASSVLLAPSVAG